MRKRLALVATIGSLSAWAMSTSLPQVLGIILMLLNIIGGLSFSNIYTMFLELAIFGGLFSAFDFVFLL